MSKRQNNILCTYKISSVKESNRLPNRFPDDTHNQRYWQYKIGYWKAISVPFTYKSIEHTLLGTFQLTISRFNWIKWSYATKRTRKNKHVYRGCFQFVWELIKRFHKYIYPIRNVKIYRIFVLGFYARRKRSFAFARFPFTKVLSGDVSPVGLF